MSKQDNPKSSSAPKQETQLVFVLHDKNKYEKYTMVSICLSSEITIFCTFPSSTLAN